MRRQAWQPWTLLTNLPLSADRAHAGLCRFVELLEVYRSRWEIELCFKFRKQHRSYAPLTSRNENGITVLIWMARITAVLWIGYQRTTGIDRGGRRVQFWFAEAARAWTQECLRREWAPGGS